MTVDHHQAPAAPHTDQAYRGRLSLRFVDPRLEATFGHDYFRQSLRQVRVSLLVGGFLYAAFGLLDTRIVPESTAITWAIRYAVVCPVIAGMSACYYMERHARADYLKRRLIRHQTVRLQAALAQVEEARRAAEEQSRRDGLTSLFNRSVTASLGVATIPAGERWDPDTLIDRVDQALYAAKKAGRNRVAAWTGGAVATG